MFFLAPINLRCLVKNIIKFNDADTQHCRRFVITSIPTYPATEKQKITSFH